MYIFVFSIENNIYFERAASSKMNYNVYTGWHHVIKIFFLSYLLSAKPLFGLGEKSLFIMRIAAKHKLNEYILNYLDYCDLRGKILSNAKLLSSIYTNEKPILVAFHYHGYELNEK